MAVKPAARFQSARDWAAALTPPKATHDRGIVLVRRAPVLATSAASPQPVRPVRPIRPH
jgi:hypothetical protein